MKSKLLISTAVFAVAALLGPASAGSLSDSAQAPHSKTNMQLAQQEKGGSGGMSGGGSGAPTGAAPESKGGAEHKGAPEKGAQQKGGMDKGATEKGAVEKGGMEKKGAEKSEKGEKSERRGAKSDMKDEKGSEKKSGEKKGDRDRDQKASDKGAKDKSSDRAANSKGDAKNVRLDNNQQTRVKTVIKNQKVTHLSRTKINFSINVGTRIPASVHWYSVPTEVVEIVPEYRGYYYIIVDEDIIIIAPETREIVTVIRLA